MKHKCYYCKEEIQEEDLVVVKINGVNRKFHKEKDCHNRHNFASTHKCKHCRKKIMFEDDYEEHEGEYIHADCIDDFLFKRKEVEDWDKVYKYVKLNLLKYPENMNLSPSQVNRLRGMRDGKTGFKKGEKQQYNGYPFHIIYLTLLYKTKEIERALMTKEFKNEEQKVNYLVGIVANSINDVYTSIMAKEESDKRLIATVSRMNEERNENKIQESVEKTEEVRYNKSMVNKKLLDLLEDTDELGI